MYLVSGEAFGDGVDVGQGLGGILEGREGEEADDAVEGGHVEDGGFDLGEVSFHLGWTFHKAGANTSNRPRSVMTVIYMDAAMRLAPALNAAQVNDHDQWCPGAVPGAVIATHKNPVIWPLP